VPLDDAGDERVLALRFSRQATLCSTMNSIANMTMVTW
jgi:hypothetical protein